MIATTIITSTKVNPLREERCFIGEFSFLFGRLRAERQAGRLGGNDDAVSFPPFTTRQRLHTAELLTSNRVRFTSFHPQNVVTSNEKRHCRMDNGVIFSSSCGNPATLMAIATASDDFSA
ncbi:MAG: hypothetical protein HY595_03880 [Candidatus Omnitrophica bacterium]|nr:hypothetical protein [Candidatus Omnitrophota bacterium]